MSFNSSVDAPKFLGGFRPNTLELGYRTERVESITLCMFAPTGGVWRWLQGNITAYGRPLSDFIRVDGANCHNTPYDYDITAPQRLLYRPIANEHPTPSVPVRVRPRALLVAWVYVGPRLCAVAQCYSYPFKVGPFVAINEL